MQYKKIMVRVVFLISILICFYGMIYVSATTIKIEGENPSASNAQYMKKSGADLSGANSLMINVPLATGQEYFVEYKFNIPKDGYYSIEPIATQVGTTFTSPFDIQINGGNRKSAVNAKVINNISSTTFPNVMRRYYFGTEYLKQGENIISFIVTEKRSIDELAIFYIDYCEILDAVWKIEGIISNAGLGIFEESQNISFDVNCSYPDSKDNAFEFSVSDYWGAKVIEDKFTINKGSLHTTLYLGKYDTGWYRLTVKKDNKQLLFATFSVVPEFSSRQNITESPFAYDAALSMLATKDTWKDYARALRLSGVKWMRDRLSWGLSEPQKGEFYLSRYDELINTVSNEGIKMSIAADGFPKWTRNSNGLLSNNLFDAYNFYKKIGERYGNKVNAWEILNEQDSIMFLPEAPDYYSAYFKSCAIALSDTSKNPLKANGSFTKSGAVTNFDTLCLQNDIAKYLDIYNYHRYGTVQNLMVEELNTIIEKDNYHFSEQYNNERKPFWLTESGIKLKINKGTTELTDEQFSVQANFYVTSFVESLSDGAQKHFWFVLPHIVENGQFIGTFYKDNMPYPSYTAESVLTKVLGKAKYVGELTNLPVGVRGHMIDSGEGHVAVLWSDMAAKVSLKTDKSVSVIDIMGGKKVINLKENSNTIDVNVSNSPIYVCFDSEADKDIYLPIHNYITTPSQPSRTFSAIERVVLCPKYENSAYETSKYTGYKLKRDKENVVNIEVYNFNKESINGVITPLVDERWEIEPKSIDLTVNSFEMKTAQFKLKPKKEAVGGIIYELGFDGYFNGEKTSRAVSHITVSEDIVVKPLWIYENAKKSINYTKKLIEGGIQEITDWQEENAVKFKNTFSGSGSWAYPEFVIDPISNDTKTSGICFETYCEEEFKDAQVRIVVVQNDGRRFFTNYFFPLRKGWNQYHASWSEMSNLDNQLDMIPVEPSKFVSMSIGINTNTKDFPQFAIRNIGPYYLEGSDGMDEDKYIEIKGISEGQIIEGNELLFEALIPDRVVAENSRVTLGDKDLKYTLNDKVIKVSANDIEEGKYILTVNAYTSTGKVITKRLSLEFNEGGNIR